MAKAKKKKFKISDYVDPFYLKVMMGAFLFISILSSSLIFVTQRRESKQIEVERLERESFQRGLSQAFNNLSLSDFIFPEQYGFLRNPLHLQREPTTRWTEDEVQRLWIPIEDTGIEDLTQQNRDLLKSLLKEAQ
ncbi:MAG: hypothetical protein PF447_03905 [Spirochaetaceae bacterium]|jgi:hypothetical protein|nr:hypothetical protein [Spirochaetaceae bacterium]